jgi:hypothetical protein
LWRSWTPSLRVAQGPRPANGPFAAWVRLGSRRRRLYVGDGNGLAIESTYERLTASLGYEKPVFVGIVKYADWKRGIIPEGNTLAPYLHKRSGFEYEHEVRAIVQEMPTTDGKIDWSRPTQLGLEVPVDVSRLVTRVRLSPVSASWYQDVVSSVIAKYGYEIDVTQSDLAGEPVF